MCYAQPVNIEALKELLKLENKPIERDDDEVKNVIKRWENRFVDRQ